MKNDNCISNVAEQVPQSIYNDKQFFNLICILVYRNYLSLYLNIQLAMINFISARLLNRMYVLQSLYTNTVTYNESIRGTDTVKSMIEGLELMINRLVQDPVHVELHILCTIQNTQK